MLSKWFQGLFTSSASKDVQMMTINITSGQVFLGGANRNPWVHIIFSTKEEAFKIAKRLFDEKLVKGQPNIYEANSEFHGYPENTCFFRVHPMAYSKIADQYGLELLENLKTYSYMRLDLSK